MATKSTHTRLVVGSSTEAWDFSGVSNSLEVSLSADKIENTRFQDSGKTYTSGDASGSIKQNGYFDATDTGSIEQELAESIANNETLYVGGIFGTNESAPNAPIAYVARATNTDGLSISSQVGNLITLSGSWFDGLGIKRGLQVYRGTITATGTTSYIDLGAAGSAGGYAWIWITAVTGTATNASIILQSDDNTGFSSPATEATFTFSGKKAVEASLSGAIDRYLRLSTSSMGGATNFTVCVVAAVDGVTYNVA